MSKITLFRAKFLAHNKSSPVWATCKASMPSIHSVELPIERTLLLGSLNNKLQYYQGGWAAAEAGLNCDGKMLKLLLLMMIVMVTIIRRDRTQL